VKKVDCIDVGATPADVKNKVSPGSSSSRAIPPNRLTLDACDADRGNWKSLQGCVALRLAPIERIVHIVSDSVEFAFVAQTLFVEEVTTSFAVPLGTVGECWGFVFVSMRPQERPATDRSGGDRATRGRAMDRNHPDHHRRSIAAHHGFDCGCRPSEVATSVRSGGHGGSASHAAITSAKAMSSSSGSASTTARNSYLAVTSDVVVIMTGHTETGWRSSAVAEIT
jgi:hypothetical protein